MSPLEGLALYSVGSAFVTLFAVLSMIDEGYVTRFDVFMTVLFAVVLWPIGLIMLIAYAFRDFDWNESVWESEEHERSKGHIFYTRSEEE